MGKTKATIKDVARKAGVSIATVSRYFTNPRRVKKDKREKIADAVKKLNYQPNLSARKLAGGKLNTIGVIIPGYEGIFNSFYGLEILRSLGEMFEEDEYDLLIHIFWGRDRFKSSLVEGVIFADIIGNESQFLRILQEDIPCVVLNKRVDEYEVSYVIIDNFQGAFDAVNFLIGQGHKIIAHIGGDLRTQCAQERLAGYKTALTNNGLEVNDKYIKIANFSPLLARRSVEELFSYREPPTAVFCSSDDMALEVLDFARERGIKVPDDLSLIGFDDNPQGLNRDITLSTVRQPLREMVSKGVKILKNNIVTGENSVHREVIPPELIIRDSVTHI